MLARKRIPIPTMKPSTAPLAAAAVLPLLLAGCGPSADAKEPGRFSKRGLWSGYSIKFPEDWQQRENFQGADVVALSPLKRKKDWYQENVAVLTERVPGGTSLDEYMNISEQYMFKMLGTLKILRRGKDTIDGKDARWLIFSHNQMGVALKGIGYVVLAGGRAHVIVCNSTAKGFKSYRKRFKEIAHSLRIE